MVAVPPPFFVTVTVVPDTEAVAMEVLLDVAVIAPSPTLSTVKVVVVASTPISASVLLRLRDPAALPIFHVTSFASLVPPIQ